MKIALICSAGCAPGFAMVDMAVGAGLLRRGDVLVITDRICRAEQNAAARDIKTIRITNPDQDGFSADVLACLREHDIAISIFLFSRIVASTLYRNAPVLNIHPSLLPAFPGLGALKSARALEVRILGATLHVIDGGIDSGKIISQVATPISWSQTNLSFERISYIQKTYLAAVAIDLWVHGHLTGGGATGQFILASDLRFTPSASPALQSASMIAAFEAFQRGESVDFITP